MTRVKKREFHKYYRYVDMWTAAEDLLHRAKESEEGAWYPAMASVGFSAFCLEGFLNHLGADVVVCWAELERKLGPKAKLLLLAERLGVPIDLGTEPWQSFQQIFRARTFIVHPKTELYEPEPVEIPAREDVEPVWAPDRELEKLTSIDAAETFLAQAREAVELLWAKSSKSGNPFFVASESEGASETLRD